MTQEALNAFYAEWIDPATGKTDDDIKERIYDNTNPASGAVKDINSARFGPDVRNQIVELALLERAYLDRKAAAAEAAAEEAQESVEDINDYKERTDALRVPRGADVTALITTSGYINTGGDIGSTVNTAVFSNPGLVCHIFPVAKSDQYTIYGAGGEAPRLWCLTDSSYKILSHAAINENTTANGVTVTAAQDGYLIVNLFTSTTRKVESVYSSTIEQTTVGESDREINLTGELEVGYIATNVSIGDKVSIQTVVDNPTFMHIAVKTHIGDRFFITGTGGSAPRLYCIVNSNKEAQIVAAAEVTKTDFELVSPCEGWVIINVAVGAVRAIRCMGTKRITEAYHSIRELQTQYIFGQGINCKWIAPSITGGREFFTDAADNDWLSIFYTMYDSLCIAYPDYVVKENCDMIMHSYAQAHPEEGIVRPDVLIGDPTDPTKPPYPIYLYKFIPAYTKNHPTTQDVAESTNTNRIKILIVSGTHAEPAGMYDLFRTMEQICSAWQDDDNLEALRWQCEFYIIPCSGPWGLRNHTATPYYYGRVNYNGVDLNRNMPTTDWTLQGSGTNEYSGPTAGSEYETKLLKYYIDKIKPFVFIDHHSFYDGGSNLIYITSRSQKDTAIGSDHISTMTRRWKNRYDDVFDADDVTTLYGYAEVTQEPGARATYAHEKGAHSFIYESASIIHKKDDTTTQSNDSTVSTIDTDGFCNFLLNVLKTICD